MPITKSCCNMYTIENIAMYLNVPLGSICYSTDGVLTTIIDKENVEGFASIVLRLADKSTFCDLQRVYNRYRDLSPEQRLLCYQWLEHFAMYADQAAINPSVAKNFLKDINKSLESKSYMIGHLFTIADVASYHVLYSFVEKLSIAERESLINLCRWFRHVQAQLKVNARRKPLNLVTLNLSFTAPLDH